MDIENNVIEEAPTEEAKETKGKRRKDAMPSDERELLEEIKDIEACIEAILFAAGYPMKYSKIAEVLGMPTKDIKRLIGHMEEYYNSPENKRGLVLLMYPDTCQLTTEARFLPYIREALGIKRGGNLSQTALEVLSVVAYNQPVTRALVDKIRGVDSAYAVSTLIDKELIAPCGRLDAPGRPVLYATTEKFLRVFGFASIEELPDAEGMQSSFAALAGEDTQLTVETEAPTEETTI